MLIMEEWHIYVFLNDFIPIISNNMDQTGLYYRPTPNVFFRECVDIEVIKWC